jgi:hypothetical protein
MSIVCHAVCTVSERHELDQMAAMVFLTWLCRAAWSLLFAVLFVVAVGFFMSQRKVFLSVRAPGKNRVVFKHQLLIHHGLEIDNASVSGDVGDNKSLGTLATTKKPQLMTLRGLHFACDVSQHHQSSNCNAAPRTCGWARG